jgi:hypothetical protein
MNREYEVTYIAKEHLSRNEWKIVAFNPPGAQGTFTIPNPQKDPTYRGQTGSESPDIVALKLIKDAYFILIVEAKPKYNASDVEKMKNMFKSSERREVFLDIVHKQCLANNIDFNNSKKVNIVFAKAHYGSENLRGDLITFRIALKNVSWNPENFRADEEIYSYFKIDEFSSSEI